MARYSLFHPNLPFGDEGRSAADIVGELVNSDEFSPMIGYYPIAGGPVSNLSMEYMRFISDLEGADRAYLENIMQRSGSAERQVYTACFGSGSAALYLILKKIGVEGKEVATTSLNYSGVVNAIVMAGAKPSFVDVGPDSFCMDPIALAKGIGKKTAVVVITHMNRLLDMAPFIDALGERVNDVPIIQDACLAIGSKCKGLRPGVINVGKYGATVLSFATSKVITGLGGGLITATDASFIQSLYSMAYQGVDMSDLTKLAEFGGNFKMNDINAAIAIHQLGKREKIFSRRRRLAEVYGSNLSPLVASGKLAVQDVGEEAVITHYAVRMKGRDDVAIRLANEKGISIGMWHSHHLQKIYVDEFGGPKRKLPATEALANEIAFLPFHTQLSDDDVAYICKSLGECL